MIRTEELKINGKAFVRTTSDAGRYVVRDGFSYEEAIDPAELGREYTEGELIPTVKLSEIEEKAAAYDILMGGA